MSRPPMFLVAFIAWASAAKLAPVALPSPSPKAAVSVPLWDSWYTITGPGGDRFGYYRDRVEKKADGIHFKNDIWKKENGACCNTENTVAMAESLEAPRPLFFNFEQSFLSHRVEANGYVSNRNQLTVSLVERDGAPAKVVKRSIPVETIFSTHFPLWIASRLREISPGASVAFYAILEDPRDPSYSPVAGRAWYEKKEARDRHRIRVDLGGMKSSWLIEASGNVVAIEMMDQGMKVNRVTESQAKSFLSSEVPAKE